MLVVRLWISSALVGDLLDMFVAGLVVEGLSSGWIGIAHGAIDVVGSAVAVAIGASF